MISCGWPDDQRRTRGRHIENRHKSPKYINSKITKHVCTEANQPVSEVEVRACTIKADTAQSRIRPDVKRDGIHPWAQSAAVCPIRGAVQLVINIKPFFISSLHMFGFCSGFSTAVEGCNGYNCCAV